MRGNYHVTDSENCVGAMPLQNTASSSRREYQFVFITGASGSGTTMLTRILSFPSGVVALGGNYTTIRKREKEGLALVDQFDKANADMWDRKATPETHQRAKSKLLQIIDNLLSLEKYLHISHVVYKRSAPFFFGDRYRPDLSDLLVLFKNLRIIAIYRDPRASTASSFRRGFAENLRQCAVICEEQLTYVSAQLATLNPDCYRVISYEALCSQPQSLVRQLADFCQLPVEGLSRAVEQESVEAGRNGRWQQDLDPREREFLIGFFDERRKSQWRLLVDVSQDTRPIGSANVDSERAY